MELPAPDPFPAAPEIHVVASGLGALTPPFSVRLRLALDPSFGLVVFDSTIVGTDGTFRLSRLLPENRSIFAEASVINGAGQGVITTTRFAGQTRARLTLLTPDGSANVNLGTRHPRFTWRSASVTNPPGPWVYELHVTNVATQTQIVHQGITDTVFVLPDTLQVQTSYRWSVIARLTDGAPGDFATASSASSFVVFPTDDAPITLLYQNFPNPFPAPSSANTCIWFDLQRAGNVRLSVLDLRGRRVKTLIPGVLDEALTPGRYGRSPNSQFSGCDPRLTWDGTAEDGRIVPPGVYLLHFTVDGGTPQVVKMLFRGR
jgi:hypothetical protein